MEPDVLVVDIGTGAAKIECFDSEGTVIERAVAEYVGVDPQRDTIDPEVWYSAVVKAVQQLSEKASLATLRRVVLSGQMQDVIPVCDGRAVVPAVLYFGHRTSATFTAWLDKIGVDRIVELTHNWPDTAGFAAKLLYLQEEVPSIVEETQYVLCGAHDYIAYRLTGIPATDPTTASTTGLYDPVAGAWVGEIAETLNGWGDRLPPIHRGNEIDGTILPDVADQLGLPQSVKVVHGVGDVGASVLAMEMEGFSRSLYLGTSGWILDVSGLDQPGDPSRGVFTLRHPIEDRLIRVAPILTAAGAFEWFVNRVLETDEHDKNGKFDRIARRAAEMTPQSAELLFLPYLAGERSPFKDPDATGLFLGLRRETDQAALFRAIEEGVAFSVRSIFEALFASAHHDALSDNRIVQLTGGGAGIEGFPQLIADVLQVPIAMSENARFSGTTALFNVVSDFSVEEDDIYKTVEPAGEVDGYSEKYALFLKAYSVNRELMAALRTIS